jgi:LPS-assembly lipoprotein
MSRKRIPRTVLHPALLLSTLIAACGFQLRGAVELPEGVRKVYVATSDELSPFAVQLDQALRDSGAAFAGSAGEAAAVIRIEQDHTGQRVLSVSARNTPQEYQVYYSVQYSIDRAGQEAVPRQSIELTRSYSYNESAALAKDREEAILREAIARDLADLVVRRLASL